MAQSVKMKGAVWLLVRSEASLTPINGKKV
jgi:hypothetical protein